MAGVAARAEGEADSQRGNDRKTRARAKAKALSANGLPRSDGSGVISMNENRRPARLCDCIGVDEGLRPGQQLDVVVEARLVGRLTGGRRLWRKLKGWSIRTTLLFSVIIGLSDWL